MMNKKIYVLPVLAILASCGHSTTNEKVTSESNGIKVKIATVGATKVKADLHYSGTVEPSQTIPLTFQTSGTVTKILVEEGDVVRKGQLLAIADKADNESMYNAAVAKYHQAKDAYDRLKSVHDKGSLTDIKWVEMETNLKQAESQMELTKSNLDKCYLKAPDNGMIGRRNIEPGQSAMSASAPIELVKINTVQVKIAVPENEISKIRKGMKAKFTISALNDKAFEGNVTNVGIVADRISRTYDVKIAVPNPNLEMKPGMVCDVAMQPSESMDQAIIPYSAVTKDDGGKPFVFVVNSSKKSVKKTEIRTGTYDADGIIVYSGITPGDVIVTEGKEKLSDNSLISL
ncbi:MAG: efflux RND transporter periplasmic adaptor subunit [Bacteroidota bacterium]|nr:efflux RND transporter periplasmic adaptor subunit [Bacteroidota bacterium]